MKVDELVNRLMESQMENNFSYNEQLADAITLEGELAFALYEAIFWDGDAPNDPENIKEAMEYYLKKYPGDPNDPKWWGKVASNKDYIRAIEYAQINHNRAGL
jgi:hypothetical protein